MTIPDYDDLRRERSGVILCKAGSNELELDLIGDAWDILNDMLASHERSGRTVTQAGTRYEIREGEAVACTIDVLWMADSQVR